MNIEEQWEKALKETHILRGRARSLHTFASTDVPYIFLADSAVNDGNTVVRTGHIKIDKPLIILPEFSPQFEGFEFRDTDGLSENLVSMFLLMRGIKLPSMKYNNSCALDVDDNPLDRASGNYLRALERAEDVTTALIRGPEECWQLSLLLYMAILVDRSVPADIRNFLEKMNQKH